MKGEKVIAQKSETRDSRPKIDWLDRNFPSRSQFCEQTELLSRVQSMAVGPRGCRVLFDKFYIYEEEVLPPRKLLLTFICAVYELGRRRSERPSRDGTRPRQTKGHRLNAF